MAICQWTQSPLAKNYLDAETPALTKDEKGSCTFCQKPTRNANLAKFARPNSAKFCLSNCVFRGSEYNIFFENVRFVSAVFGLPGYLNILSCSFSQDKSLKEHLIPTPV